MKAILLSGSLLMSVLTANIASAQTKTPVTNKHSYASHHRIHENIHTHSFTYREPARVKEDEERIRAERGYAKAEPRITSEAHHQHREGFKTGHDNYEKRPDGYVRDIF